MNYLNRKIESYLTDNLEITLQCDELDKYDLPTEEKVPEGYYASVVMGLRNYKDKYGKLYTDVCYKIFSTNCFYQWDHDLIDKIPYFYIRQRYRREGDEERKFRAAMSTRCKSKTLTEKNLVGITEVLSIKYNEKNEKGYIAERIFDSIPPNWFTDDISDII